MKHPDTHIITSLLKGEYPADVDVIAFLDNMCRTYPYSQVLHMLRARVCQDAGKDNDKTLFQIAYAYAPDKMRFLHFIGKEYAGTGEAASLQAQPSRQAKQQAIVDRFLQANPRITPRREELPEPEVARKSLSDDSLPVSETLAEVLLKQGKTSKALDIYEKLCLKYPEKSSYFAKKIQDIQSAAE